MLAEAYKIPYPALPLELCDQIIDYLWDNPRALAACGATSREWVPTSRLHLFRRAVVHCGPRCRTFQDLLETSPLSPVAVAPYVHELVISRERPPPLEDYLSEDEDDWTNESLLSVLFYLDQVECLTLRSLQPEDLDIEARVCLGTFSPSIHTLHMESVEFKAGIVLRHLLFGFPRLESVSLRSVTWEHWKKPTDGLETASNSEGKIQIHKLVVEEMLHSERHRSHGGIEAITNRHRAGVPFQFSLRHLEWSSHASDKQCNILNGLLREAGTSLRTFKISFHPRTDEQVYLNDKLNLLANTRLENLQIVCPRDGYTMVQCAWVPMLLNRINSTQFREVRMVFGSCGFQEIFVGFLDWELTDQALAALGERVPQLAIVFQIGRQDEVMNEYVMTAITARLPQVRAREMRIGMSVTCSVVVDEAVFSRELLQWW
ncbi:hypothetical protein BKA93DRAFT_748700 [Sparassis latifolia]